LPGRTALSPAYCRADRRPATGAAPSVGAIIRSFDEPDEPFDLPNYSSWDTALHGPAPHPDWLVTELSAIDTDLGVLKTGKEADVNLVRRAVPGGRECLLAAKRYRDTNHRLFHRDAGYEEGRRVRRSRETRAMSRRTEFGRELLSGQWAAAEFDALSRLWTAGAPVPYPVQRSGTEVMLEFVGDVAQCMSAVAAPRLAQCRPDPDELAALFAQCVSAMHALAGLGCAHGDLSAYNLLVQREASTSTGRLLLIDLPQIVDVVTNPQGPDYLRRDCENVCAWFTRRGLPGVDIEELFGELMAECLGA
jgi:RIO kinase 1